MKKPKAPKLAPSTERVRAFEERLREEGGAILRVRLPARSVALLDEYRGKRSRVQGIIELLEWAGKSIL